MTDEEYRTILFRLESIYEQRVCAIREAASRRPLHKLAHPEGERALYVARLEHCYANLAAAVRELDARWLEGLVWTSP